MTDAEKRSWLVERELDLIEELTAKLPSFDVCSMNDVLRCMDLSDYVVYEARRLALEEFEKLGK